MACIAIVAAVMAALAAVTAVTFRYMVRDPFVLAYWMLANCMLVFCMYAFIKGRRFNARPVAPGRVAAIIPAYEEDPAELRACIDAILNQSIPPDQVFVVDDGSVKHPVVPFPDPRITWLRQPNQGKRAAQVHALKTMNPVDWDFILTVDGDSVLDHYALEHQLRAMSKPSVMATTGMVLVRNMRENLLTRIADLNIGTSCVMMRASRSLLGTLETTSGALAVYRAHILFKHADRYLNAGTYGDDRCLAMYSALEGEVVGVNEAVVWSAMPPDCATTYHQRLRWSKSWWCMIPFVLTNMNRFRQMFFPLFGLLQLCIAPITLGYIAVYSLMAVHNGTFHPKTLALYIGVYLFMRYGESALYMVERPGLKWYERVLTWLFLTPFEAVYNLLFLNPTKYIALIQLRDQSWGTRGAAVKREIPMLKRTMIFVSGVALGALALGGTYYGVHRSTISADLAASQAPTNTIVPLTNASCSGGKVVFTFDGGPLSPPAGGTPLVLSTLRELHATGVFFVLGTAATQNPQLIRQEVADGDLVENHTWDHADFTGQSAGTKPLTAAQIKSELQRGAAAIVAAGAPAPTLYRPPFDDITPADNAIAASLGERVVMSYGNPGTEIIDSQDWRAKFTGSQIAHDVIYGYTDESGTWIPGLDTSTGSMTWIIGYHDGLNATVSTPAAESLPIIVQWMNENDMCSTNTVPADATGGVVPNIPVKS